jgi:DNA-directed RNA polymerase subunit RPC12/RpoP
MRTARSREDKGDKSMNHTSTPAHPGKRAEGAVNRCHRCGATAYKSLIARDAAGAMRPSGRYQCVQCQMEFAQVSQWREGMAPVPT